MFLTMRYGMPKEKSVEIPTTNLKCIVPMRFCLCAHLHLFSHCFLLRFLQNYFENRKYTVNAVVDAIDYLSLASSCGINISRKCSSQSKCIRNKHDTQQLYYVAQCVLYNDRMVKSYATVNGLV